MVETVNNNQNKKFVFVSPRFGADIIGGAETLMRNFALKLHQRGYSVEAWTTCAKDNRTWQNDLPVGEFNDEGITVKRFAIDDRNLDIWIPLQIKISEGLMLSDDDLLDWMQNSVNSKTLYNHIAQHADEYNALFFAPYLFGTTFWGSLVRPDKSILIPCLHNENTAYLSIIASMFRKVKGCLFNAQGEMDLALQLYGDIKGGEVGMGFDPVDENEIDNLSPYFDEKFEYILYLGRKETLKNVAVLVDYFIYMKEHYPETKKLKLVIGGGGSFSDLHRDSALERDDIIDLDRLSEIDKQRLLKHALLLCQPSPMESFSIVIMESWQVAVPVLVNADCAVTRQHVIESSGGLYYNSPEDFYATVSYLWKNPDIRKQMGEAGKEYVKEKYNWNSVVDRFTEVTENIENEHTYVQINSQY